VKRHYQEATVLDYVKELERKFLRDEFEETGYTNELFQQLIVFLPAA